MNTKKSEDSIDALETLLIMALEKPKEISLSWHRDGLGESRSAIDMFPFDDAMPSCAYTFDAADDDRIFGDSLDYLIHHPADTIGTGKEVYFIDDNTIKWSLIEPTRRPAKGFACLGRADKWYAAHYRLASTVNGWFDYVKAYLAIDAKGNPLPVKFMQQKNWKVEHDLIQIHMMCSLIEDAHRAGAVLASVSDQAEIRFPIGGDAYKEFFSLRDGPRETPTGKRNPIIHWVSRHIRKTQTGGFSDVKQHLRGRHEVTINGIHASVEFNDPDVRNWPRAVTRP